MYDNLAYDADPHLHCLEPTQHIMGTRSKLDQSPINNSAQSHVATSMIAPNSLAKPSPCIPGTDPLHALLVYLLGFVNRMARTIPSMYEMIGIGIDKPP